MTRDFRVNLLLGSGHFFSHFYQLCLPPLFLVWQRQFDASFAELGLSLVMMSVTTAVLQTPYGFLVDRFGARRFLIGGAFLMSGSIALMSVATGFWEIVVLSLTSGIGNAVFHPADYSILAASIRKDQIGRAFSIHTFTGNVGFAAAPPVVASLLGVMGWREAVLVLGVGGMLVAGAIAWQSGILSESVRKETIHKRLSMRALMFERTMVSFFLFYLLGSMAASGLRAWLITVLHEAKGVDLTSASWALTAFLAGVSAGALAGGWAADSSRRRLALMVVVLTTASAAAILALGLLPVGRGLAIGLTLVAGLALGGSRTPRDVMLKDVAPPGEIGKVFGFVSTGLPLGGALTPVPFGILIDHGHPGMVLIVSAGLLVASLLGMRTRKVSVGHETATEAVE